MRRTFEHDTVRFVDIFGRKNKVRFSAEELAVLERLTKRMDELEKADSKREIEWTMWYDKFRTLFMRLAKRAQALADAEPDAPQSRENAPRTTIARPAGVDRPIKSGSYGG